MPEQGMLQKKWKNIYGILFAIVIVFKVLNCRYIKYNMEGDLYITMILVWRLTVERCIVQENIRRFLRLITRMMVGLFVIRMCRYDYFTYSDAMLAFTGYLYYIPLTMIPFLSYMAALCVGKSELEKPLRGTWYMWLMQVILAIGILTNGMHGWLFTHTISENGKEIYYHHWLYIVVLMWAGVFTVATFVTLMRRCSVSGVRTLWYVPVIPTLVGVALLVLYLICGGSPAIRGVKLYNLQEVYCFIYLALFEGCIRIGLIPSNTEYDELFVLSSLNMAIGDENGNRVYQSGNYITSEDKEDILVREQPISGGKIIWSENRKPIRKLNDQIRDAIERIEEENELIRQENEVQEQRLHYEAKNRLYDKIAAVVRPQVLEMEKILEKDKDSSEKMLLFAIMGAYVKRRGNLELLASENPMISSEELVYAIRESFEYLTLADVLCDIRTEGKKKYHSELLILAYNLFETVVESGYPDLHACAVVICAGDSFAMELYVDSEKNVLPEDWNKEVCDRLGTEISVKEQDDTVIIRLEERIHSDSVFV